MRVSVPVSCPEGGRKALAACVTRRLAHAVAGTGTSRVGISNTSTYPSRNRSASFPYASAFAPLKPAFDSARRSGKELWGGKGGAGDEGWGGASPGVPSGPPVIGPA